MPQGRPRNPSAAAPDAMQQSPWAAFARDSEKHPYRKRVGLTRGARWFPGPAPGICNLRESAP
jgi:hypothetical protein